jgi:hypothetical protein
MFIKYNASIFNLVFQEVCGDHKKGWIFIPGFFKSNKKHKIDSVNKISGHGKQKNS